MNKEQIDYATQIIKDLANEIYQEFPISKEKAIDFVLHKIEHWDLLNYFDIGEEINEFLENDYND